MWMYHEMYLEVPLKRFTLSDASISYVLTIGFLLDDIKTPNKIFGTDLARAVAGFSRGW